MRLPLISPEDQKSVDYEQHDNIEIDSSYLKAKQTN